MPRIPFKTIEKELDTIKRARSRIKQAEESLRRLLGQLRDAEADSPMPPFQPASPPQIDEVTRERAKRILRASAFVESK